VPRSVSSSHDFFGVDLLFVPTSMAALTAALITQTNRLRREDLGLAEKLIESSSRMGSLQTNDAEQRLLSGLKLIQTVLSPIEAVVFRRDAMGQLVSSARLRSANSSSSETGRNSAWRDGVGLCERAMAAGEILVEKSDNADLEQSAANIALPLRHEGRTVGAVLLRRVRGFDEEDRALLTAVGGQMARNLQREEVHALASQPQPLAFFSARAAEQSCSRFTCSTAPCSNRAWESTRSPKWLTAWRSHISTAG